MAGVGDGARELSELQFVAEKPRRLVRPGLDHVHDGKPEEDAQQWHGRQQAIRQRLFSRRRSRGHDSHSRISRQLRRGRREDRGRFRDGRSGREPAQACTRR